MRVMTSRARNTVPLSSSYSVQWSSIGSNMCMSAGCTVARCEYRNWVMNSCLKTCTSATMSADDMPPCGDVWGTTVEDATVSFPCVMDRVITGMLGELTLHQADITLDLRESKRVFLLRKRRGHALC